jgi:predicted nuclease with TOPRIM domain
LSKQIAEQDAQIRSLTEEVERLKGEKAALQQSDDTLARLREEAASEVAQVLQDGDEVQSLEAEWEELKSRPVSQEIIDRMNAVLLRMKVIDDLKSRNRG